MQTTIRIPKSDIWIQYGDRDQEFQRGLRSSEIVTSAELAECSCPDVCERDHEWD